MLIAVRVLKFVEHAQPGHKSEHCACLFATDDPHPYSNCHSVQICRLDCLSARQASSHTLELAARQIRVQKLKEQLTHLLTARPNP
mmetsp:Transcript_1070/g.1787  ORF Transcript_1070/g.1787 Transcript_1070/m.1787 type:complete len:86 (+) Transcript_1070:207-464(+)